MKDQFSLEIKTPCQEKFENFKKTKNGGFCDSCSKEVKDFTKMTSLEIVEYFKKNSNKNTCGQFFNNQLKIYPQKPSKKYSFLGGIGLACLSLFAFGNLKAQEINKPKKIKEIVKDIEVKGIVSAENLPLPGVNIYLEGSNIGTQTDFNGKFTFPKKLKKGDVLIFAYLGYESKKVIVATKNANPKIALTMDVRFEETSCILLGAVDVKKVYSSKKKS